MTSTQYTPPTQAAGSRPRALMAALVTSAAAGVLTIVSQGLVLAGGEDAAREAVQDEINSQLGSQAADLPSLVDLAVSEAQDTLATRAWLGIVVAVVVLALTAVAARAGRAARIALVVFLAIGALLMLRSVSDVFPSDAMVPGVIAVVLAPIAAVLLFLPGVNRYRTARRAA